MVNSLTFKARYGSAILQFFIRILEKIPLIALGAKVIFRQRILPRVGIAMYTRQKPPSQENANAPPPKTLPTSSLILIKLPKFEN